MRVDGCSEQVGAGPLKAQIHAILATIAGFAVVLLVIWGVDHEIVHPAFKELEQAQALEDGVRARAAIQNELRQLENILGNWAEWDDAYIYAANRNPAFIASNLGNWSVLEKNSQLNLCVILNPQGQRLYSGGYDSGLGGEVLPATFARDPPAIWNILRLALERARAGLVLTEHGLLLLAAHPILTTQGRGQARGVMVFGRFLDQPLRQLLAAQIKVAFELLLATDPRLTPMEHDYLTALHAGNPELRQGPAGATFAYEVLVDLTGQPIALLRTPVRQTISITARRTSHALAGVLSLAILTLLIGGAYGLIRFRHNQQQAAPAAAWGAATLTVLIGLTLTAGLYTEWRQRSQATLAGDFRAVSSMLISRIITQFYDNLEDIDAMRRFLEGVDTIDRAQFRAFVTPLLANGGFQALEWLPRVPREQRAAYEAAARRDGFEDFHFTERDEAGRLIPATDRPVYFPVYYLEPLAGNQAALGFAPGPGHPARGAVLAQACDRGQLATTGRYVLVQETAPEPVYSVLVFGPVYAGPATALEVKMRREQLRGFALGVVRIGDTITRALAPAGTAELQFRLLDLSAGADAQTLYELPPAVMENGKPVSSLRQAEDFHFADRTWRIEVWPSAAFLARHTDPIHCWVPAIGGLLTLLATLYLFALIAQRYRAEALVAVRTAELQGSEERYRLLFERASDAIFVVEKQTGRFLAANRAAEQLTGRPLAELKTLTTADLTPVDVQERLKQAIKTTEALQLSEVAYQLGEIEYPQPDGALRTALLSVIPVNETLLFGIARDITDVKEAKKRIEHLAFFDALTTLPNRVLLTERAELALALAERHHAVLAVLFLDLDRFKEVNDSLGHTEGDALLVQVAARLKTLTRGEDTVCRLGGDEFVLLLPEANQEGALRVADKVLAAFRQPFTVATHALQVTVSIGIALYPHDGADFAELLKNADTALYQAKQDGRNTRAFYDRQMNVATFERLLLEAELRKALAAGHLCAYFQPKVRLADGTLAGAEALIRWFHPERGAIPPGQFIPLAEASDLIVDLGEWMLTEVCRQLAVWQQQGRPILTIAVNLAARHFCRPALANQISGLLAAHDLPPHALELELTESTLLETGAQTADTLAALERLGIGLAIDDFGTGYSSLSYLKRLPLTALKIDQSFVRNVVDDPDDRILAATIVALGHQMELVVVAEGVETEEQRRCLLEQGCDLAQGYLFDRPVPAEDFAAAWLVPQPDAASHPSHRTSNPK